MEKNELDRRDAEPPEPHGLQIARATLGGAPDPQRAAVLAEPLLEGLAAEAARHADSDLSRNLPSILLALCGVAPFFVSFLRRHREWLTDLIRDDLSQSRNREQFGRRVQQELGGEDDAAESALRRAKYRELARITVRDASPQWVPLEASGETLSELSGLADALLEAALAVAQRRVRTRCEPPRKTHSSGDVEELGFCVLGLGKLGSEELNYSSDVDLIYVYEAPGPLGSDIDSLAPEEYFTRVAQEFGRIVTQVTEEGSLYRVDLELRPRGSQGTLTISDHALLEYYESWADTWERATFMKARPVAGDLSLGWRIIRSLNPMIYRAAMDYQAVAAIRDLKERIRQQHGDPKDNFNVKLDSGGIRDIEFIVQALQLLHGGRIPQVRDRSTQGGLRSLAAAGLLDDAHCNELLDAYRFLRRVENRLQMESERQVHVIPEGEEAGIRLARSVGFLGEHASEDFRKALDTHRARVLAQFTSALSENGSERILELFDSSGPRWISSPTARSMLEDLAHRFAVAIDTSADPQRALNNLDRFVRGVGGRRFYYELLLDRPELVSRLAALFAASAYLSGVLARHPRLIEPVFRDPARLLLSRDELRDDMRSLTAESGSGHEQRLDALRLFRNRQILNVGLLHVAGTVERCEAERALTQIAEVCLEAALDFARDRQASQIGNRGRFLVVGMGKLASFELSYGSDLDLIFLYDASGEPPDRVAELQHAFVRLTQTLISSLQTPTAEGICYEVDARLRPSGNQGTLVTSLDAFRRYHETSAVWEQQALLRARPIAGDARIRDEFEAARRAAIERPLPSDAAQQILHVRQRMERELAHETPERRNFKTGRGGALDVESAVEYLRLCHGGEHPEFYEVDRIEHHLDRLEHTRRIEPRQAAVLREGWEFLQSLASHLRIVDNRSISDLDDEHGDLQGLARRFGYPDAGREGGARRALLDDYHRHTEAIRAVYRELLGEPDPAAR